MEFFTAKSFGSVRGKRAWNIPPPQTNGIGVDVTCLTVSTPVFLRSVIRPSGQWDVVEPASRSAKLLGELQGVQPPHPGRVRRFVISLSGLLSPKFEFVWIPDVVLFQSLMCLFLMQWSVTADLMANREALRLGLSWWVQSLRKETFYEYVN